MTKLTAVDVMTREVWTAHPDWSLELLLGFFADRGISGAPVAGDDGVPVGVVSLMDVARSGATVEREAPERRVPAYYHGGVELYVSRGEIDRMMQASDAEVRVKDLMTPMVFSVTEATPVQEIAEAMITGRIHRVFVTRGREIVGIVSAMDLLPVVRDA